MKKTSEKSSVILSFTGAVLSLAALLIFVIIPTSKLANGIEYSGTDALWVLVLSPLFSLAGSALFITSFLKNFSTWADTMSKPLVKGMIILLSCMSAFNFIYYLSYFISQVELGFVAPYTGLIYDKLFVAAVAVTIHQFFFSVLALIAKIRNNK